MFKLNRKALKFLQRALLLLVFLVLGLVLTSQYLLYRQITSIKGGGELSDMAARVSTLYGSNKKLTRQLSERTSHRGELESAVTNTAEARRLMESEREKYLIIMGLSEAEGPGVSVSFNYRLDKTQLIDLVNALRNSGAEAIAINGKRVLTETAMQGFEGEQDYLIEVIGESEVLHDALTRPGGIFDIVAPGEAEKSDKLTLPKAATD